MNSQDLRCTNNRRFRTQVSSVLVTVACSPNKMLIRGAAETPQVDPRWTVMDNRKHAQSVLYLKVTR